jgi:hypothetical protein
MNAPASTAAMRGVHPALSDMEDDGHRVVGLVQALMLMGFGAHMNDVPAEAILTLGEAMLGAAESVRDQWRGAIELTRTAETEAVSAADMAMPPDPASLGRIRAIVHERLQAAEGRARLISANWTSLRRPYGTGSARQSAAPDRGPS